jgi:hypothetical protein
VIGPVVGGLGFMLVAPAAFVIALRAWTTIPVDGRALCEIPLS